MENKKNQIEILQERISWEKFIFLKEYPNKALLSKSKILKVKNNSDYFDQRCHLLIEFTYLLFKIEIEKSEVFISKNIFINYNSEVYMFYTFDSQYSTKLSKVSCGNLLQKIMQFFNTIFVEDFEEIDDYQKRIIYLDMKQTLFRDFVELNERQKEYYYKIYLQNNFENKLRPNIISTVLDKCENSKMFKEYNYLLKYKTAIIIRALLQKEKEKELYEKYIELIRTQSLLFQKLNKYSSKMEIENYLDSYIKEISQLLSQLQKYNYIKIKIYEKELEYKKNEEIKSEHLTFASNLRRQNYVNKTDNSNSSESSVRNQQQNKNSALKQSRQNYENLCKKKNTINFSINIKFNHFKYQFEIIIQGISEWKIQEFYYCIFIEIWNQFINQKMYLSLEEQEKFTVLQIFLKDKNVGIRQILHFNMNSNIIQDIIISYDQLIGFFLLFENTLKNIFKFSQHEIKFDNNCINKINNSKLIENLLIVHQQASKKYQKYKRELINLTKYL